MSIPDIAIGIPIAILYPAFSDYLSSTISKKQEVDDKCSAYKYSGRKFYHQMVLDAKPGRTYKSEFDKYREPTELEILQQKKEFEKCFILRNEMQTKKFIILMAAGIVAIIAGGMVRNMATAFGLVVGGIINFVRALFMYWDVMDDKMKTIATGISLGILLLASYQMYNNVGFFGGYLTKKSLNFEIKNTTVK